MEPLAAKVRILPLCRIKSGYGECRDFIESYSSF
jgi:hypothetical protein